MATYGDYLRGRGILGGADRMPDMVARRMSERSATQPSQRERTTFNTTQSASTLVKPMAQRPRVTGFPKPVIFNNSFGMGKETDDFITSEKRKHGQRGLLGIGDDKEIDCDLDERIFGSKRQHKDIF
ncbi:MAG: hypothetical protein AB7E42_09810 [Anaerotignaceae bacterium]